MKTKEKTPKDNAFDVVGICHPKWRGIRAATYSLVPRVFEVSEINSYSEAQNIASEIMKVRPQKVVLSGYPRGYNLLAKALKKKSPTTRIFFLSHTPFTWYFGREMEVSWLKDMFEAYDKGYIEKIGFAKKDTFIYFKNKGVNAFFVMNRPPEFKVSHHKPRKGRPQIGVWGSNMWHRNLLNQIIAGSMIKSSKIHVNEVPDYFFWDNKRIKRYGILPREKYLLVLKSMDINLYVSFTECFPMTVIESMAYSIPCLVSDTSEVYTWSKYLKNNLVVSKIDSPISIKEKIEWVFKHYKKIQSEMAIYLPVLNKKIERSIKDFLK